MTHSPSFLLTDAWLAATFPELHGLAPLSRGGQKLVFTASHATDGDVVLKLFQPTQSVEEVQREILAVQRVQSPRVPSILAHGSVLTPLGPCYWLREQRIHGVSLRERLSSAPLTPRLVLTLGMQVLEALVAAEDADIVHRDVKPENIMVDTQDTFWLLDFGLARHLALTSLTATATPWGKVTLGYAPREQCRNDKRNIDARADLFALGITLYESATGVNPFLHGARDHLEILRRVETLQLPPLDLPITDQAGFRDLVAAMTQKRRDHRPASAREAAEWLGEICRSEGL